MKNTKSKPADDIKRKTQSLEDEAPILVKRRGRPAGDPGNRARRKRMLLKIDTDSALKFVVVTNRKGDRIFAQIDGWWWPKVSTHTWRAMTSKHGWTYFATTARGPEGLRTKHLKLHTFVYELKNGPVPKGMVVDHRDRDTLNNKEANLRAVPFQLNVWNSDRVASGSSRFPGVSLIERTQKWQARVQLKRNQKATSLGRNFKTEEAAFDAIIDALKTANPGVSWGVYAEEFKVPFKAPTPTQELGTALERKTAFDSSKK